MVKSDFIKLMTEHQKFDDQISSLANILCIEDVWESSLLNYGYILFDRIIDYNFNEEGKDIISWYLYENFDDEHYYPIIDTEIRSLDDLWEIVKTKQK